MTARSSSESTAIIGAGIAGLCLARELALRGTRVCVVDRAAAGALQGGNATPASVGVLSAPRARGSPLGRLQALSRKLYPSWVRDLERESGRDVGFKVAGCLRLEWEPPPEAKRARIESSFRGAGADCGWIGQDEVRRLLPASAAGFGAALHVRDEATLDPPELARALAASLRRLGAAVLDGVGEARLVLDGRLRVEVPGGEAMPDGPVVLAAGAWSGSLLGASAAELPVRPIRGQAIALRSLWEGPHLKFRPRGKERDYHVIAKGGGVVWVGSTVEDAGFDPAVTEEGIRELVEAARVIFPEAGERDVIRAWAGLRPQALKRGGPFVGPLPGHEGVWVHCGHYRSGILLSPLTAKLLAAQMCGDAEAIRREGFQPEELDAFLVDRQE